MRTRYKSLSEMIRAVCSRAFRVKYYLSKRKIPLEDYQDLFRFYEDEYQPNEPEIETDNYFYNRWLRRK